MTFTCDRDATVSAPSAELPIGWAVIEVSTKQSSPLPPPPQQGDFPAPPETPLPEGTAYSSSLDQSATLYLCPGCVASFNSTFMARGRT
jgi:hypothetical protein